MALYKLSRPQESKMISTRRTLLTKVIPGAVTFSFLPLANARAETFEVTHNDADWRKLLSPAAYDVLRHQGTEAPWSSPLEREHRKGTYACAGCALALFSSDTKFESGTGWPSFYRPLPNATRTTVDRSWVLEGRTEIHCRRCGGHLGHVFDDGPKPTGLRYCMNGVALKFSPVMA
jgi:peptide-methionine (R)-S-oxide reductase